MPLEIGSIVEGRVTGITKFGAFVELPEKKTGMVHISEVAATYVNDIADFVHQNDVVRVKVISITPEGKINLSMKRVEPNGSAAPKPRAAARQPQAQRARKPYTPAPRRTGPGSDVDFSRSSQPQTFEEMMSRFKQTSDDKMSDLKRNFEGKRGAAPHNRSRGRS